MDDPVNPPTRPLRAAHRELHADVELLRATADLVGEEPAESLCLLLGESLELLVERLIPYARAEAALVYPIVEEALAAPGATRALSGDVTAMAAMAEELAFLAEQVCRHGLCPDREIALRRVLYELHGIARLHCAKEEDLYFPALDAWLDRERGAVVARDLHEAVDGARSRRTTA